MHAAFAVGVFNEILEAYKQKKFNLVGLSGTSAGALCALMVWYGLAPKKKASHSRDKAIDDAIAKLNQLWNEFVACNDVENLLNLFTWGAFKAEEMELPLLGLSPKAFGFNPYAAAFEAFASFLPDIGVRKQYFNLDELLAKACPALKNNGRDIDWKKVTTRLLIGASEVVDGLETVFDSDVNKKPKQENIGLLKGRKNRSRYWRQQLPLSLAGVAASGTLPFLRDAEHIKGRYYWDGLYSQNPPVREFLGGRTPANAPDEIWIIRINPQQWPYVPKSNKDIQDRQNELMGNLSLNKELDFILKVNEWTRKNAGQKFGKQHKEVTVRSIIMDKEIADNLSYSSKFDRSHSFMDEMRREGRKVACTWLHRWERGAAKEYPEDAAFDHSK